VGIIELGAWTDDRVTKLKSLWESGLSCAQIAAELGQTTRNAVIGKVQRLGLSGRIKNAGPKKQRIERAYAHRPRQVKPKPSLAAKLAADPEVVLPEFAGPGIPLIDLNESNCHWPKGDWADITTVFCGGRALTGLPYCAAHSRLAYDVPRTRRRTAEELNSRLNRARPNNYYQR